jgi:hypothetical protein
VSVVRLVLLLLAKEAYDSTRRLARKLSAALAGKLPCTEQEMKHR